MLLRSKSLSAKITLWTVWNMLQFHRMGGELRALLGDPDRRRVQRTWVHHPLRVQLWLGTVSMPRNTYFESQLAIKSACKFTYHKSSEKTDLISNRLNWVTRQMTLRIIYLQLYYITHLSRTPCLISVSNQNSNILLWVDMDFDVPLSAGFC